MAPDRTNAPKLSRPPLSASLIKGTGLLSLLCVFQAVTIALGAFGILVFNETFYEDVPVTDTEVWLVLGAQAIIIGFLIAGAVTATDLKFGWSILGSLATLGMCGYFLFRIPGPTHVGGWPAVFAILPLLLLIWVAVLKIWVRSVGVGGR